MNIEEKLIKIRFNIDSNAHIKVDTNLCLKCPDKPCLFICPVQNYTLQDDKLTFSWQGCVECGACRIACCNGAIDWNYPRGGFEFFCDKVKAEIRAFNKEQFYEYYSMRKTGT